MKLLVKGGRVIDPANKLDETLDILVEGKRISEVSKKIKTAVDRTVDAKGKIVIPGLVDMHVHLREPGREDKETVLTGTRAAAKGGVTSILAMPNTDPAIDCVENLRRLEEIIEKDALVNVFIAAAITKGRKGKELNNFKALAKAGVTAITDDGASIDNDQLSGLAFKKAKEAGVLVICHSEDKKLSRGGVVNLGFTSTRMGLRGISKEAEFKRVRRDVSLAGGLGAKVHIAHLSCKESVEIIAAAKKRRAEVTAETAPHYFSLTEEAVLAFDTNTKINPPLRGEDDRAAVKRALKSGVIDVIASDHAPHTENEKEIEFERAKFGTIGLETELAVAVTSLIEQKVLTWSDLVEKLAHRPARILSLGKGTLSVGADADIAVISPKKEWVVRKEAIVSKSKNSCFLNKKLKGVVDYTICQGEIVYQGS